jgi:hypothetical protein
MGPPDSPCSKQEQKRQAIRLARIFPSTASRIHTVFVKLLLQTCTQGFSTIGSRLEAILVDFQPPRAYAQRDSGLIATKVEPLLKNLHNDPRFAAFLKKLNLPN